MAERLLLLHYLKRATLRPPIVLMIVDPLTTTLRIFYKITSTNNVPVVRGQLRVVQEEDVLLEREAGLPQDGLHARAPGVQAVVLAKLDL